MAVEKSGVQRRGWERFVPLSGIGYVVLLLGSAAAERLVDRSGLSPSDFDAPADAVAAWVREAHTAVLLRHYLLWLGLLFLLVFLGSLWGTLRRAEEGPGWVSLTAFGAGVAAVTIQFVQGALMWGTAAMARRDVLDPQVAKTTWTMQRDFNVASFYPLAALLAATALLTVQTGVLPRWLGWAAAVIAGAFIVGGAMDVAANRTVSGVAFLLWLAWLCATSITLVRRRAVTPTS